MGRPSDSKKRLLDAGRDLVWKRSYGAVTIDAICAEAGVKKGSFYHFFDSKSELVAAVLTELWGAIKPNLDRAFSPAFPPLDRLQNYFKFIHDDQFALKQKYGHAVGCLFSCLGSELGGEHEAISAKTREVLSYHGQCLETALRDAQTEGSINISDLPGTAQRLASYVQGSLLQARVHDNLELINDLWAGASEIIGVKFMPVPPPPADA
ncbi:MAG TPA: TetR/AcrR family transcriptional regulator [Verrucomicrobiae bacterium]|nr:TetR/AcrR family transcriptional regulator [Verrucomicrobiae bacterium]